MSHDKSNQSGSDVKKPTRKRKAPVAPRRTRLLALEQRVLYDGALAADVSAKISQDAPSADAGQADAFEEFQVPAADRSVPVDTNARVAEKAASAKSVDDTASDRDKLAADLPALPAERNEIVFVDTSVQGYEALLSDVNPDAKVVLLDGTKDGLQQIADYMATQSNIDAIHIVSHGDEGMLQLGTATVDSDSMRTTYAAQLIDIGKHMSADADILVYGCDFAKGVDGQDAATRMSLLTGADVAASDDLTGAVNLGGDWDLERAFGAIETDVAFGERAKDTFQHILATLDWDTVQSGAGWSGNSGTYAVGGPT